MNDINYLNLAFILVVLCVLIIIFNQLHRLDYFYRKKYCTKVVNATVSRIKLVAIFKKSFQYYLPAYGFKSDEYPEREFYNWLYISEENLEIGDRVVIRVHPNNPNKFYFPMEKKPGIGNSVAGLIGLVPMLFIVYCELNK